jgi:hypothetical protein
MAGSWSGKDDQGSPFTVNITQSRSGLTFQGQWTPDRNWGSAQVTNLRSIQNGLKGMAILHGFYPTLYVEFEYHASQGTADDDVLVLHCRSEWTQNGQVQSSSFPALNARRLMGQ